MNKEYNFPTLFQSYFRKNEYKKIETNKIKLNSDKLIIETSIEEKSKGVLNVNNYSNKENKGKEYSLDEILYVKKKCVWIQYVVCLVAILIFIGIYEKVDIHNKSNLLNIGNLSNDIKHFGILSLVAIVSSYIFAFFLGAPYRQIIIKLKNKEKVSLFYYKWNKLEAKDFLEDLKFLNANVKIKDINKRNNIIITILILFMLFSLNNKYIEISKESQLRNALIENTCYVDITMEKSEDDNTFILKYFSKDNNQLIDTKYVPVLRRNYDILSFREYNKEYYYEQSSKKIYEFNNPEYDYSKERNYSHFTVEFYSNDTETAQNKANVKQIYNFATSDLEEQEFGKNKKLKKLGKYESRYGTCNIIQGINILYNGENDYYNVIENNEGNHSAIIITHREGFGTDYNNYIDYFKTVISEK